jgi:thiol-disulfide isomerase/thioredoxin
MDHDKRGDAGPGTRRRAFLAAAGAAGAGLLAGCIGGGNGDGGGGSSVSGDGGAAWRTAELRTVRGDESFTIADLASPVVIQSFAVWCPKCRRQSEQLAEVSDSVTVVGLNTDPNEDAGKVRQHAEENGFDWRFAVSPSAMTDSLVEAFGTTVTNAPSTPVIVACGDGDVEFFSGSVNDAGTIRSAADGC